jgi:hypothetical protein
MLGVYPQPERKSNSPDPGRQALIPHKTEPRFSGSPRKKAAAPHFGFPFPGRVYKITDIEGARVIEGQIGVFGRPARWFDCSGNR